MIGLRRSELGLIFFWDVRSAVIGGGLGLEVFGQIRGRAETHHRGPVGTRMVGYNSTELKHLYPGACRRDIWRRTYLLAPTYEVQLGRYVLSYSVIHVGCVIPAWVKNHTSTCTAWFVILREKTFANTADGRGNSLRQAGSFLTSLSPSRSLREHGKHPLGLASFLASCAKTIGP